MSPGWPRWHPDVSSKVSKSVNLAWYLLEDKLASLGRVKMAEWNGTWRWQARRALSVLPETQYSAVMKYLKYLTPLGSWDSGYCHSPMSWFFELEFKLQILKIVLPATRVKEKGKKGTSNCVELNMFFAKYNVLILWDAFFGNADLVDPLYL